MTTLRLKTKSARADTLSNGRQVAVHYKRTIRGGQDMKPEKLATIMLSPPKEEPDLVISRLLVLPVTLTAQILYKQAGDDAGGIGMRFSTHAGEAVWAVGTGTTFIYGHPHETLDLQVNVSHEGLQAVGAYVLDESIGLTWLNLHPIPEGIIDHLPAGVADEIRQNQLGNFAGDE